MKRRRIYTPAQVAQHTQLMLDLQKNNARTSHLLLRLGRVPLQHHRFEALCEEFTSLERSMTLQIFLCEQIVDSGAHQHYDVVNIMFGCCDDCLKKKNDPNAEALIPTETWAIQVEQLSGLMASVAHYVSEASCSQRCSVEQSLSCLAGLSKVLSRQRRHLQQITIQQPTKLRPIHSYGIRCPDCGRPYPKLLATDEADQCM